MGLLITFASDCVSRVRSRPHAVWIAVATIVFVAVWRECAALAKPAHFAQKAIELGSVAPFRQTLYPNSSGSRILFARDTEVGIGFFLWQGGANAKLLYQHDQSTLSWTQLGLLGWSTDDTLLAYACQISRNSAQIIVADGESGKTVEKIPAGGTIVGFTWLSPSRFTYMSGKGDLYVFEKTDNGKWIESARFKNVADVPPNLSDHLAAGRTRVLYRLSDHEVAWLERGSIWSFDLASRSTQILWRTNTGIIDASFCPKTEEFLLEIGNDNSQSLYAYSYSTGSVTNLGHSGDKDHPLLFLNWVGNGKGYAYLMKENGNYTLFVSGDGTNATRQVFSRGGVWRYASGEDSLFICGSMTNEPPGIWEYDLADNQTYCIVPASKQPFVYAQNVLPEWDVATNDIDDKFSYCVWSPIRNSPNKNYPIIFCQTPYNWTPYAEVAANEGFYFVSIDRKKWLDPSLEDWGHDVKSVYNHLSGTLNIDTNSVYLLGASAETVEMTEFLLDNPHFCKGALLYHPTALPSISRSGISRILIVDGDEVPGETKRDIEYEDEALIYGIPVTVEVFNTQHNAWGVAIQRQYVQIFARYLCGL